MKMSNTIYYWDGGTDARYGKWRQTTNASMDILEDIWKSGYVAYVGSTDIGPPEGPPCSEDLESAGNGMMSDRIRNSESTKNLPATSWKAPW